MAKKNLLHLLIEKFPDYSEKELFALIMCGDVKYNGGRIKNPKEKVDVKGSVEISGEKYVSRGGYKLESGLQDFNYDVTDLVVIDAGCSTGGFTDCLLQHGASKVYAVDVGFNQLAWSLKQDQRVVDMEKTNIMAVESLDPVPHLAVADLSFRSITGPAVKLFHLICGSEIIVLVKPQFEWKDPEEGFKGIVKDPGIITDICREVVSDLREDGIFVKNITLSQVKGRKGNQELLFLLTNKKEDEMLNSEDVLISLLNEE